MAEVVENNRRALKLFHRYSNVRPRTAAAVRHSWEQQLWWDSEASAVLDFGAGDGQLLDWVLADVRPGKPEVVVVEPEDELAHMACYRFRHAGRPVRRAVSLASAAEHTRLNAVLAAHVLFYVDDVAVWLREAVAATRSSGIVTVVARAPACDGYRLRSVVRASSGQAPRMTPDSLDDFARSKGWGVQRRIVVSDLQVPTVTPFLARIPADSPDPDLAAVICWMTAAPFTTALAPEVRAGLEAFLVDRYRDGAVVLRLVDEVVDLLP